MRARAAALAAIVLGGCVNWVDLDEIAFPEASPQRLAQEAEAKTAFRERWTEFDSDGDSALNRDEWRNRRWGYALIFDADNSGDLDAAEFVRSICGVPGDDEFYRHCRPYFTRQFLLLAGRRDGRVSHTRYNQTSDDNFRVNDKDNDRRVSRTEYFGNPRT